MARGVHALQKNGLKKNIPKSALLAVTGKLIWIRQKAPLKRLFAKRHLSETQTGVLELNIEVAKMLRYQGKSVKDGHLKNLTATIGRLRMHLSKALETIIIVGTQMVPPQFGVSHQMPSCAGIIVSRSSRRQKRMH
jgi:hypothetical protein